MLWDSGRDPAFRSFKLRSPDEGFPQPRPAVAQMTEEPLGGLLVSDKRRKEPPEGVGAGFKPCADSRRSGAASGSEGT